MWLGRQIRQVAACRRLRQQLRHRPPLPLPSSSSSSPSLHFLASRHTKSSFVGNCSHHVPPALPLQGVGCRRRISSYRNQATCGEDDKHKRQAKAIAEGTKASAEEGAKASVEGASQATSKKLEDLPYKKEGIGTSKQGFGSAVKAVFSMSRADWASKLRHWKTEGIMTLKHYWVGTKLLWTDVRVSSRLLLKLSRGKSLSRRERQQLTRTTADMFRLVPFAIFIVVPFMELLLPVFLKVFPNMLPSTFQDKIKEEEAQQRRLTARMQYAKFLQDTVKELAKEIKTTRTGDIKRTAEDLDDFMSKVRTGERVSNDDILGFAKLFNDEITLDNLSRPRLVSLCKYMGIKPYGTDAYLCYMLRSKLAWIKNDDQLIHTEGIELLSEAELQAACRERGMLSVITVEEMRQQLKSWVDLSLNHSVPSSLLILSRAFTGSGKMKPEEAVQATLSSLPDEVVESVGISELPSEGLLGERMRKLEFIKSQDEMIKKAEESQEDHNVKVKKN